MNLTIIPFHDWRKCEYEGFRTRDSHIINALEKKSKVNKIIVVNRPTTLLELKLKKRNKQIKGSIIFQNKNLKLIKVSPKIYIVDLISKDIIGQASLKHRWFIKKYGDEKLIHFINECFQYLDIKQYYLLSQNVFCFNLALKLKFTKGVFDAWDNFLKFPVYSKLRNDIDFGYNFFAKESFNWASNSKQNIQFFRSKYAPKQIILVKNGVSLNFCKRENDTPEDLTKLKQPIIGFGGKISHLLDVGLINFIAKDNPDLSFVFVGQILDKTVYEKININKNIFFLGDKHYSIYHNYVSNFDICIIPYYTDEKQHGGDSIKAYEYLSYGKKTVGTPGNGLLDLQDYIYIAENKKDFSKALKTKQNLKKPFDIKHNSWDRKASQIIKLFDD